MKLAGAHAYEGRRRAQLKANPRESMKVSKNIVCAASHFWETSPKVLKSYKKNDEVQELRITQVPRRFG